MVFFDYKKSKVTADRLITKFGNGKFITITRKTEGSGRAWDRGEGEPVVYRAKGVVLPASKGSGAFDIALADELIMQMTHFAIMSAKIIHVSGDPVDGFTPQPQDLLEWNGRELTVLGCTPLSPAGDPVYFPIGAKV